MKWATAISFLTAGVLATPVPAPDAEALVLKVLAYVELSFPFYQTLS